MVGGVAVGLATLGAGGVFGWRALARAQSEGRWMLGRECPLGTQTAMAATPGMVEHWCQESAASGRFQRHGLYRAYYTNGQLKTEGWYVHGQKHRPWHWWTEAGKPDRRGKYKYDRNDGFWMTCSPAGAPVDMQVYDQGKPIELVDAAELARRAAKAGPDDIGHFRWGHEKIQAWCSGAARP